MTIHKHQMGADAADGASAIGAMRRLALGAHDERQDWSLRSGQGSLTRTTPNDRLRRVATRRSHHPIQFARGLQARDRRQASGFPSLARESVAALNSCRAIRSGGGTLNTDHHVRQDIADVPESHFYNASLSPWFNATTDSERHDGTLPDHPRELQKHNGAPQHECC